MDPGEEGGKKEKIRRGLESNTLGKTVPGERIWSLEGRLIQGVIMRGVVGTKKSVQNYSSKRTLTDFRIEVSPAKHLGLDPK